MKKVLLTIISLVMIFQLGCVVKDKKVKEISSNSVEEKTKGEVKDDEEIVDGYMEIINMLYNKDKDLNDGIKYIAIDTSNMRNLSEEGEKKLLKDLEGYGHTVLKVTMKGLKEKGFIEASIFKEGILFEIKHDSIKNNKITMVASKYRSGLGAIGLNKVVIERKNNKWEIIEENGSWVS